ncbi:MAG: 3-deoxy-D-manno-octulosonic acid transferase [Alphaproteobacteria bacterium]|nr:3-deoxy-D-manno-octulosonic acid transferase [Alphaproteobacteria bacterium]
MNGRTQEAGALPATALLPLYRLATWAAQPFLPGLLARRAARGKEDPTRMAEKLGRYLQGRPAGPLVWLHGASVGEAVSALPLIEALLARDPRLHVLLTTGTRTSAEMMARRLPPRALHQFAPLDAPAAVARFLDHWRPDAGLLLESELWPNLIAMARVRGVPLALVNARLSTRSAARWQFPGAPRGLFAAFARILAQDATTAERLKALGARDVAVPGNLKYAAPPLPADPEEVAALDIQLGDRPRWVAASTHPGEETQVLGAHARLRRTAPDALLILVPRHPERGAEVAALARGQGLAVTLRSAGEAIGPATAVHVADTLGELGLFYRAAALAFLGGSLVPHGGQNALEAARLGCAILHGPHIGNFAEIYARLDAAGGAETVADGEALATRIAALAAAPDLLARTGDAARALAVEESGVVDRIVAALAPILPPPAPETDR